MRGWSRGRGRGYNQSIGMRARDFGIVEDPNEATEEEVRPYRGLSPRERYARFLDLMRFLEGIWNSLGPERRAHYDRIRSELDDPGRWWERVPRP